MRQYSSHHDNIKVQSCRHEENFKGINHALFSLFYIHQRQFWHKKAPVIVTNLGKSQKT